MRGVDAYDYDSIENMITHDAISVSVWVSYNPILPECSPHLPHKNLTALKLRTERWMKLERNQSERERT